MTVAEFINDYLRYVLVFAWVVGGYIICERDMRRNK